MKPIRESLNLNIPPVEGGEDPCVRCPHLPVDPRVLRCEHRTRYPDRRCPTVQAYLRHEAGVLQGRGVPARALQLLRSGKLQRTEALEVARRHFRDLRDGRWLVLSGPTGTGKTVAAVFILLWMFRVGERDVRFAPAYDFSGEKTARVLVLDDLGLEEREWPVVREIYRRYDRMLPLVITTNLPIARIRQRYGERVYSRIREAGVGYELVEGDIRKGKPDGADL